MFHINPEELLLIDTIIKLLLQVNYLLQGRKSYENRFRGINF